MTENHQTIQMPAGEIFTLPGSTVCAEMVNMRNSADIFDEDDIK